MYGTIPSCGIFGRAVASNCNPVIDLYENKACLHGLGVPGFKVN